MLAKGNETLCISFSLNNEGPVVRGYKTADIELIIRKTKLELKNAQLYSSKAVYQ